MDLKAKIRVARKEAGFSQQDLSDAIGVSDKAISAYEVGRSTPPIKVLERISSATEKPMGYFINVSDDETTMDQILAKLETIEREMVEIRKYLSEGKVKKIS